MAAAAKLNRIKQLIKQPKEIYIGVRKEGLTPTEIPRVMKIDDVAAGRFQLFSTLTSNNTQKIIGNRK